MAVPKKETIKKLPVARRLALNAGQAVRLQQAQIAVAEIRARMQAAEQQLQGMMNAVLATLLKHGEPATGWTLEVGEDLVELVEVLADGE